MFYDNLCRIFDFVKANKKYAASEKTAQGKLLMEIIDNDIDYRKDQKQTGILALAERYRKARELPKLKPTQTVPDPAVSELMKALFGHGDEKYMDIHREAMAAENVVGKLLEFYIAEKLEPLGWIWCAGELIQAVDFIKRTGDSWEMLQVKNRSNSENSSSKAIRKGTNIKHWYRTNAVNGMTRWEHFPDSEAGLLLSEADFHEYIKKISAELRS